MDFANRVSWHQTPNKSFVREKGYFDSNLSKFNNFRCCKLVRFPLDILCIQLRFACWHCFCFCIKFEFIPSYVFVFQVVWTNLLCRHKRHDRVAKLPPTSLSWGVSGPMSRSPPWTARFLRLALLWKSNSLMIIIRKKSNWWILSTHLICSNLKFINLI